MTILENNTKKKKIITSALPYVNNSPHLGNIVGCVLSADVYARYCRMVGEDVVFICGTDDYGTATEIRAKQENTTCEDVVYRNRTVMMDVFRWFSIDFDYFGQTSDDRHARTVQEIFMSIQDRVEEDVMTQYHCGTCEMFLADRYLTGTCGRCGVYGVQGDQCDSCGVLLKTEEIVAPECAICKHTPMLRESTHIFLRLNAMLQDLQKMYKTHGSGWSKNAQTITEQWLTKDLHKRCITRDLQWGVRVPGTSKVFYVWFDAVIGYLSFFRTFMEERRGIRYGTVAELCADVRTYELVQFMGKDNVPFHTIIFPAITDIIAHRLSATEYLMFEGRKFSKSKQTGIFGTDLLTNEYGPCDLWRYYLLRTRPETKDTNFSVHDFTSTIADLQNNLGNLCHRVLMYVRNRMHGHVVCTNTQTDFVISINSLVSEYHSAMHECRLRSAVYTLLNMCTLSNQFLQQSFTPSAVLCKNDTFAMVFSVISLLAHLLSPFMPSVSQHLLSMCMVHDINLYELTVITNHYIGNDIAPLFTPLSKAILDKLSSKAKELNA